MKTILIATTLAVLTAAPAWAADLPTKPSGGFGGGPPSNWTGFYLGAPAPEIGTGLMGFAAVVIALGAIALFRRKQIIAAK